MKYIKALIILMILAPICLRANTKQCIAKVEKYEETHDLVFIPEYLEALQFVEMCIANNLIDTKELDSVEFKEGETAIPLADLCNTEEDPSLRMLALIDKKAANAINNAIEECLANEK